MWDYTTTAIIVLIVNVLSLGYYLDKLYRRVDALEAQVKNLSTQLGRTWDELTAHRTGADGTGDHALELEPLE